MQRNIEKRAIKRIIDANVNRVKEGLRVCEEITRFILNDRILTGELKKVRHRMDLLIKLLPGSLSGLLKERDSTSDVGKNIHIGELSREGIKDVFFANIQRAKESLRVLEEFVKLIDKKLSMKFKRSRYYLYKIEKKINKKVSSLRNFR